MSRELQILSAELFPYCREFLLSREYCCVPLVSAFLVKERQGYSSETDNSFAVLLQKEGNTLRINGVLHLTSGGTLLHLLSPEALSKEYRDLILQWLATRKLYCILGTATENLFLEALSSSPCERSIDYELMTLAREPDEYASQLPVLRDSGSKRDSKPFIRRMHPGDAELLMPLQLGYEQEEVLAPGKVPDRVHCFATFRAALSTQEIYAAFYDKRPVAKAGTNAQGFRWNQLGGIYTDPGFRAKGIASALVAHVVRRGVSKGKNIVLFVKTDNNCAKKVYLKNGFISRDKFRISYFYN